MKKEPIKGILKHKSHKNPKIDQLAVMDGDTISYLTQKLPPNFFESIVMTEMELSEEFNHDKLLKLFQLYTQAIQYYAYADPTKVIPYQNRVQHYLTKKDTLNNLTKFNIEKKTGILKKEVKLRKVKTFSATRDRAKAIFKFKAKELNKNDIRKQVRKILKDVVILMKIDKKNLRNIINEEMIKQRVNFIEKLNEKRGLNNYWKNKRKTICAKHRSGQKKEFRKSLYIKGKGKTGKNGLFVRSKTLMLNDDDPLDFDKTNTQKDYLKLINEIDGKSDSYDDSIDSSEEEEEEESYSSSDSSSDDDEEDEDHSERIKNQFNKSEEDNNSLDKSKDLILNNKIRFSLLNKIDERAEYGKNNAENKIPENKNKQIINYIKNNIQENLDIKEKKMNSSKNITKLSLPPLEDETEKQILPIEQKEKVKNDNNDEKDKNENNNNNNEKMEKDKNDKNDKNINGINDNKNEYELLAKKDLVKEMMTEIEIKEKSMHKRRKSIETEDVIRKIELDNEIKIPINEKLERIENISEIINAGNDSNFASTRSLPAISKKITIDKIDPEFRQIYLKIDEKMNKYVDDLNKYFYNEMFDNFYIKLKEIYEKKYETYIKVNEEYFCNIKENEYLIDDKIGEAEKIQIQNIIDCLKEEQKDQIDQVLDEYNTNISNLINDYKQNKFKDNIGVQLIEEQLKLDIYNLINETFD